MGDHVNTKIEVNDAMLRNRDYTLMLDKSGSMAEPLNATQSRWKGVEEAAIGLANKLTTLADKGFAMYLFSSKFHRTEGVDAAKVKQVFAENEPNGGTNLAEALDDALNNYFYRKEKGQAKPNGEIIAVMTDGRPDNEEQVAKVIVKATKKMDRDEELGISFIQVGNDAHATAYLKRLDDHLESEGAKFDIVNAITLDDMGDQNLTDVLVKALTE